VAEDRIVPLRRAIYRFFAEHGRAPSARELGATPAALRELERAHAAVLDAEGRIAFANPFAAGPTEFAVTAGSMRWHAVCAWDSLGILAATGRDGRVRTACPDCARPIELHVANGRLLPAAAVAHFLVPAARWYDDLGHT
jgi:Alkylmercury lyase